MRSIGAARSCPTTSEPDGSAAIVMGSCTSGSRWTSTATEPSRVVRRPTVAARRQLPANGKRTVAWYRPRCFIGRSGTESVFGPLARNVPRAGGDTAKTTRYGTPLSAWRGTETAWTRGDGAPSATRKRSERALIMIGRFRRIYGGYAASCQVRSQVIRVRLFAGLREQAGWSRRELDGIGRVSEVWPALELGEEPPG